QLMESIGVVLNMISANMRTEELLLQSQSLTQELQSQSKELTQQQEELKRTNAALEKQAVELEEKAKLLEEQNSKVEVKNREVEQARVSLEEKAEQLSLISKYKSEFLANMSHELRTPLNSLLILAKLLADNKDGNLTRQQVEYASTIHASGGDLLTLINEILDLSKVEAGKMAVDLRDVSLREVQEFVTRGFQPVAEQKGLTFTTEISPDAGLRIRTDSQRLQQVLKNLLSNAFKFTDRGTVKLRISAAPPELKFQDALARADKVLAFSVTDTGIGIAKNKHRLIFEAFQQADGTTSRKYGGTGLGLSISREIARLLGGEIRVDSAPGKGSTFTLYLPARYGGPEEPTPSGSDGERSAADFGGAELSAEPPVAFDSNAAASAFARLRELGTTPMRPPPVELPETLEDDRDHLQEGDRVLLIIEDDLKFGRIMLQLAREKGFKTVLATRGDVGLTLADEIRPDAITLDIQLPAMDGWSVLDQLKRNPGTRHIPVHVISVVDKHQGATVGAFAYMEKPVSRDALDGALSHLSSFLDRKLRRLLVVEDQEDPRASVQALFQGAEDLEVVTARTGEQAMAALARQEIDCLVLDLLLPDVDSIKLIEQLKGQPRYEHLPIVVYTTRELTTKEREHLEKYTASIITKGEVHSPDRLLHDTALFLHRVDKNLPTQERRRPGAHRAEGAVPRKRAEGASLAGRKVLLVDDDARN
ncbi:MAG TPA: response regulator, partial [Myxococcaceae bacterium]|nr:response regulator [Myxococcaceae bacterium]